MFSIYNNNNDNKDFIYRRSYLTTVNLS